MIEVCKYKLLLLAVILNCTLLSGQGNRDNFINLIRYEERPTFLYAIDAFNDNEIFLYGSSSERVDSNGDLLSCLLLQKIDSSGHTLLTNTVLMNGAPIYLNIDSDALYDKVENKMLINFPYNNIYKLAFIDDSLNLQSLHSGAVDNAGYVNRKFDIVEFKNHFYATYSYQVPDNTNHTGLIKFDKHGALVFDTLYPAYNRRLKWSRPRLAVYDEDMFLFQNHDVPNLIGIDTIFVNFNTISKVTADGELYDRVKSDSIVYSRHIASPLNVFIPVEDGFLFGWRDQEIVYSGKYPAWNIPQPGVAKSDTDFNIENVVLYGDSKFPGSSIVDITPAGDGNYIASGHYLDRDSINNGARLPIHMKVDSEGNLLWSRQDTVTIVHGNAKGCFLNKTKVLDSGSIVSVGYTEIEGNQYGVVMKLSKDGCYYDDCRNRLLVSVAPELEIKADIALFPNPSAHWISLSTELTTMKVSIFNAMGQKVRALVAVSPSDKIDISTLPVGMYYVQVEKDGRYKTLKLIKK